MRYALPAGPSKAVARHPGVWRLALVFLVSILFAVVMVHWHNDTTSSDQRAAQYEAEAPNRFPAQLALMWSIATDEQRTYLCAQLILTDGTAAWEQALRDNSLEYDGFRPENRDAWDRFLTAQCGLVVATDRPVP